MKLNCSNLILSLMVIFCISNKPLHAFGRLNEVCRRLPFPSLDYFNNHVEGSHELDANVGFVTTNGSSILVPASFVIFKVKDGKANIFAGNGTVGASLVPDSRRASQLDMPGSLLRLKDKSLLVRTWNKIVRIRPKSGQNGPKMSVFAATEPGGDAIDLSQVFLGVYPAALGSSGPMAEMRDGSILVACPQIHRVIRLHDGVADVFAGTGEWNGDHIDPMSALNTVVNNPLGMAVLADDSVLISDKTRNRILRLRQGAVSVYAGAVPEAEFNVQLHQPTALALLPDGSMLVVNKNETEILRLRAGARGEAGVAALFFGQGQDGQPLDPGFFQDPSRFHFDGDHPLVEAEADNLIKIHHLAALRDGSVLIAAGQRGVLILSPADRLQEVLESTVARGKAAIQQAGMAEYRAAEHDLAYLSAPIAKAFEGVNQAARLHGQLAPTSLPSRLSIIKEIMKNIKELADPLPAERLRAQLALKELRAFKRSPLGR